MFYKRENRFKMRKGKLIQWLVFLLITVYLIVTLISQQSLLDTKKNEHNKALSLRDAEMEKNLELQKEYASIGTDSFVEKIAREVLGYVKSGEKVFYESKN